MFTDKMHHRFVSFFGLVLTQNIIYLLLELSYFTFFLV